VDHIGKYEIVEELGRGSMGCVLKAFDPNLQRHVAIKVIDCEYGDRRQLLARFQREAQTAAGLQHQNVVTVYDSGHTEQGSPFIVMQFLEGVTLAKVIQQLTARGKAELPRKGVPRSGERSVFGPRAIPVAERLLLIADVCDGLAHVHEHQIVHRDIKPANLMVTINGTLKILDFGVARVADSRMTMGGTVGTYLYMSPEQVEGSAEIDPRSDVFSLGIVLYELVTLKTPYAVEAIGQLAWAISHDPVPPVAETLHWNPPELDAVLAGALAKKPQDRLSAVEFGRRIRSIADAAAAAEREYLKSLVDVTWIPGAENSGPSLTGINSQPGDSGLQGSTEPAGNQGPAAPPPPHEKPGDAGTKEEPGTQHGGASSSETQTLISNPTKTVHAKPANEALLPGDDKGQESQGVIRRSSWLRNAGLFSIVLVLGTALVVGRPAVVKWITHMFASESAPPTNSSVNSGLTPEQLAAANTLLQQLANHPKDASVLKKLGDIYFDGRQWSDAAGYYERALAIDPSDVGVLNDSGSCYLMLKDADKAIERYQGALKYKPDNLPTLLNIGAAYLDGKNDPSRALPYLEKLSSLDPTYETATVKGLTDRARQALSYIQQSETQPEKVALAQPQPGSQTSTAQPAAATEQAPVLQPLQRLPYRVRVAKAALVQDESGWSSLASVSRLGIAVIPVSQEMASISGIATKGALVVAVSDNSPLRQWVSPGAVILTIRKDEINSQNDLQRVDSRLRKGDSLSITYVPANSNKEGFTFIVLK
jgi:serine/threonine protein kinase